ncbi:MAG: hypothetical protein Q9170_004196 [Blastenia crenularia]
MDHVPYPSTSDLPGLEIPLLCRSKLSKTSHSREEGDVVSPICHTSLNQTCTALETGDSQVRTDIEAEAGQQIPAKIQRSAHWTDTFWNYPEQEGWITNGSPQWNHCPTEEAAARAQEWLYFRLLDDFLGVPVNVPRALIRRVNHRKTVIDSSMLPHLLQEWEANVPNVRAELDTHDEQPSYEESGKVLELLTKVLQECNNLDEQTEPSRSIAFSIMVLVETLARGIWRILNNDTIGRWNIWKIGPSPLLEDRMVGAGWCPFRVAKLWHQYMPSTVYYLSSLPARTTFGGTTHDTCTADRCTSATVDPRTYEPRHRKSCASAAASRGSCSMAGIDTASIADIILQDSFPLIEILIKPDGSIDLKIHKYTVGVRYTAISHVWSGGLGNVKTNSMLPCQLRYLHTLLQRLRKDGDDDLDRRHGSRKIDDGIDDLRVRLGFARRTMPLLLWIDTLCIPVGSQYSAAYTKTLHRMAQIYVTAQCTLVLDPELQDMKHRTMGIEQTYAHLLSSSWMSRSWTFQEACMARIWFVQFTDGYFTVDKTYFNFQRAFEESKTRKEDPDHAMKSLSNLLTSKALALTMKMWLMYDLTRWFREMPVLAKIRYEDPRILMSKMEDYQNFALAWNGLLARSTTKAEDLWLIIAVVVDLSAGDILKLRHEERLQAIFRSQNTLPLPLLYQTSAKILDHNGFDTWAPSGIVGDRLDLHSGYVTVCSDGLLLDPRRWVGMSLPQATLLHYIPSSVRYSDFEIYETKTRGVIRFVAGRTNRALQAPQTICCVWDDTLVRHAPGIGTFAPGVCMAVDSIHNDIFYASYLCPIRFFAPDCIPAGVSNPMGSTTRPGSAQSSGGFFDWQKHSIVLKSDFAHWPAALPHVSKIALSKRVIIRNASNWVEFSSIGLVSGPYIVGIIICGIHRQSQLAGKLFWLCLSRWLSLLVEVCWALGALGYWDRHRTMDWTDRLYGTNTKPRVQHLKHFGQYPALIAKLPPLAAASTFIGLSFPPELFYLPYNTAPLKFIPSIISRAYTTSSSSVKRPERTVIMPFTASDILKIALGIIFPPAGVFLERGCKADFWINCLLTLLGYIPGIIHAL